MCKCALINNNILIEYAVEILKNDGIIIFPTETVLGIGCILNSKKAYKKIYKIKGRSFNKPFSVHIGSHKDIDDLVDASTFKNTSFSKLVSAFFPGEITLIAKKNKQLKCEALDKFKKVGIRYPKSTLINKVVKRLGMPILATSLNFSNELPIKKFSEIPKDMLEALGIKRITNINDRYKRSNVSSTVIDITVSPYKILREGEIKKSKIDKILNYE